MDGISREALRLECLRLATQIEGRAGVENVKICAETMFDWVLRPAEQPSKPEKKASSK